MTHRALVALLSGVYADKAALGRRHELAARSIRQYDWNNTYQYVIAREDVHLTWLRDAILAEGAELSGSAPLPAAETSLPADQLDIVRADCAAQRAFLDRWTAAVEKVTNARHRLMLQLLVGESREQLRFFEQAAAGRTDLLGRRTAPSPAVGRVLGARWVE